LSEVVVRFPVKLLVLSVIVALLVNLYNIWGSFYPGFYAAITGIYAYIEDQGAGWSWWYGPPRILGNVLPCMFFLALINALLKFISIKTGRKFYLSASEFAFVFAAIIMGAFGVWFLWPSLGLTFQLVQNGFEALEYLRPYIWWMPPRSAYDLAYAGGVSPPWGQLLAPIFTWIVLWMGLLIMFTGLSAIMKKEWLDIERLPFPSATVYTTLITFSQGTEIASKRWLKLFAIGVLAAILWRLPHILRVFWGWIPYDILFRYVRTDWKTYLQWDSVLPGSFPYLSFAPNWLCIYLLAPLDFLSSAWITWFGLYIILPPILYYAGYLPQENIHDAMEWIGWNYPIIIRHVYFGMIFGLGVIPLIIGWRYLKSTFDAARKNAPPEPGSVLSYRSAYILFGIGFLILFGLILAMSLGAVWTAFIMPLLFIAWHLGYMRVYANCGLYSLYPEWDHHLFGWMLANLYYVQDFQSLDANAYTVGVTSYATIGVWGLGNPSITLCTATTAYRVGEDTKANLNHLFTTGIIAAAITIIISYLSALQVLYSFGINNFVSYVRWYVIDWGINWAGRYDPQGWPINAFPHGDLALRWGIGILVMLVLSVIRLRVPFLTWINPAGVAYATWLGDPYTYSRGCGGAWPILLAWIIKYIVGKFYGPKVYNNVIVPIAVGFLGGFISVDVALAIRRNIMWIFFP